MSMTFEAHLDAADSAAPRRRRIAINSRGEDGDLAALDFGDPDRPIDVIFLNANGFNAMTYRDALAPLAVDLRVLAVDQQGHGLSARRASIEGRLDWLDLRDDLLALMATLGVGPVVLAGHSMGGAVSVLAAAERPELVRALALFDPVIVSGEARARLAAEGGGADNSLEIGAERRRAAFPTRQAAFDSYRGRGAFRTWRDEVLRDYVVDGFCDRPDGTVELTCAPAWEASGFRSHGHDTIAAMRKIPAPIRVLRAEAASTCHLDVPDAFNADNKDVTVQTIAGTTHFLPIERPDLVRETLRELTRNGCL